MDEFNKKIKLIQNEINEIRHDLQFYHDPDFQVDGNEHIKKLEIKIADLKNKQKKAQSEVKQKQQFIVRIEGLAPVTVEFITHAYDEEEAFQIVDKTPHLAQIFMPPKPDLNRIRKFKATVKNRLTGMINWVRNF